MSRHWSLAWLFTVMLVASTAWAAGAAEDDARALFERGNRHLKESDYVGALADYRAAYARFPNPKILLNTGTVLRQLGRVAEAAEAYDAYLGAAGTPDAAIRQEVRAILVDLDDKLGWLAVSVEPQAERIFVDGRLVGQKTARVRVRVEPGPHTVVAECAGTGVHAQIATVNVRAETRVALAGVRPVAASLDEPRASGAPAPEVDTVATEPTLAAASTLRPGVIGAVARAVVDARGGGVAAAFGLSIAVGPRLTLTGTVLEAGRARGLAVGASWRFGLSAFAPLVAVGVPAFFMDGVRPGARGAVGVSFAPSRYVDIVLEVGGEAYPSAPEGYAKTVLAPALGLTLRL